MSINVETLISEIFLHPILWDQKNKNYHNRYLAEKEWDRLAASIKQPKDLLKKKWKTIRDQFRTEFKKIPEAKSGDAGISDDQYERYTTWSHFKSLLFLKDQIKPRKVSGNLRTTSFESAVLDLDSPTLEYSEDTRMSPVEFYDFEVASNKPVAEKPVKKDLRGTNEILSIEKRKLELLEHKVCNKNERDDDELFFQSLIPFVKRLSLEQKLLCRMDLQNVIYTYAFSSPYKKTANADQNRTMSNSTSQTCTAWNNIRDSAVICHPSKYIGISSPISQVDVDPINSNMDPTQPMNFITSTITPVTRHPSQYVGISSPTVHANNDEPAIHYIYKNT